MGGRNKWRALAAALVLVLGLSGGAGADSFPQGFVYLRDVAPGILQDIRYAGTDNFLGRPVRGYDAAECILERRTAEALRTVQAALEPRYALKVFDCYRPARATRDFLAWTVDPREPGAKSRYFPTVDKRRLFARGYISSQSQHSLGIAVDLALVDRLAPAEPAGRDEPAAPCFGPFETRAAETNLDFGTTFDCFHELSATHHPGVGATARANRLILLRAMRKAGFENYSREWWHFELKRAGGGAERDVPIGPRR
jgi:D-alanyl-D-alanine dipeptidase